jgi:hypothetical protein
MKKYLMAAVALICMTMISSVLTSCGSDDDGNNGGSQLTPNTYEVTISAVLPLSSAEFYTLDVNYTDANGSAHSFTMKAGDQSESMSTEMTTMYKQEKAAKLSQYAEWSNERKVIFDQLIVKNIKLVVPSGKSFSYKATMRVRTDYTKPSGETFDMFLPFVYVDGKRISGNSPTIPFMEGISTRVVPAIETEEIVDALKIYDGHVVAEDSKTL